MNSPLEALVASRPDSLLLRLSRWIAIYTVLLFAGFNRWDGGSAPTARYVVLGLWAAVGISVVGIVRRSTKLASDQLARPNGHAEMNRAIGQQKRAEWETMKERGRRDYVWRSGLRTAIPLAAVTYSVLVLLPSVGSTRVGALPQSASLLLLLFAAIFAMRAVRAWQRWPTLFAAWEKSPVSVPPT